MDNDDDTEQDTNHDPSQENGNPKSTITNPVDDTDDKEVPTPMANYTNQNAFTPHPFIHPVLPTHKSSHQQWMNASKHWTDRTNNLPPYPSTTSNEYVPTVPHYQPMDMTPNQPDNDQPQQGHMLTHKYWKPVASETHQPHRFL